MLNTQSMGNQQNTGNMGSNTNGNVNQMLNISNQQIGQDASGGGKMVHLVEATNGTGGNGNENNPLHTPKNNLLSANN